MRTVITGGTGFVGRPLVEGLLRDGHEVTVLTRDPERARGVLPDGARPVAWQPGSRGDWWAAIDGADAVVNLAGAGLADGRWTPERKRVLRDSRVEGVRAIAEAVRRAERRPRVFLQASGVGYYGAHGDERLDEGAEAGDDFLAADVLVPAEAAAMEMADLGVRVAIPRSGIVLGLASGALPRMLLPFKLFVGGRIGSGRQWMSWIHLEDEVAGLRFLMENEAARGVYNFTAPAPVTNAEFARTVGRVMGRPAWMPVPAFALHLVYGEMAMVLTTGQRVVPDRLSAAGFDFLYPDLETALRDLLGARS